MAEPINQQNVTEEIEYLDLKFKWTPKQVEALNYWNDNYICLSYGKVIEADVTYHSYGARSSYDKRCHSIEVINLKEKKMKQVFQLTTVDNSIFIKKILCKWI